MTPEARNARTTGEQAVRSVRQMLASGIAELLKRDPERLESAVEVGLVSRDWLDRPGDVALIDTAPIHVVQRYLERSIDQKPSSLTTLGLSTLQVLASSFGAAPPTEGVTQTLAVAFVDLEGFTAFTSAEGDAAACSFLTEHRQMVGRVVRGRRGRIVRRIGDGALLTFTTAEAAVAACLELVDACQEPLRLRAGVHFGEVVASRDDVLGHVVNVAARVTESARGGEVVVTVAVRDAAGELPGVRFGRLRRRRFHGVAEPVPVCRVTSAHYGTPRGG